jgi:hypothetical protein
MTKAAIFLAALMTLGPAVSQAETAAPFRVISPIFSQLERFSMPAAFVAVSEGTTAKRR